MSYKKITSTLPKYNKRWEKERTNVGYSDSAKEVYLIIEKKNFSVHNEEVITKRLSQYLPSEYPCNDLYFFELFKYLRKWQNYQILQFNVRPRSKKSLNDSDLKKAIKEHLLSKHSKQLHKNKLLLLPQYSGFIDYCFAELLKDSRVKISLVIQKKLGYKYYENIIYT